MARKKVSNPVPFGTNSRIMKRKKPINLDYIKKIEPLTDNQETLFTRYNLDQNIVAYGAAGTGKTFITLYNAIKDVLNERTPYEKIYIVRSLVATREIGFLPGDHEDKSLSWCNRYCQLPKQPGHAGQGCIVGRYLR